MVGYSDVLVFMCFSPLHILYITLQLMCFYLFILRINCHTSKSGVVSCLNYKPLNISVRWKKIYFLPRRGFPVVLWKCIQKSQTENLLRLENPKTQNHSRVAKQTAGLSIITARKEHGWIRRCLNGFHKHPPLPEVWALWKDYHRKQCFC